MDYRFWSLAREWYFSEEPLSILFPYYFLQPWILALFWYWGFSEVFEGFEDQSFLEIHDPILQIHSKFINFNEYFRLLIESYSLINLIKPVSFLNFFQKRCYIHYWKIRLHDEKINTEFELFIYQCFHSFLSHNEKCFPMQSNKNFRSWRC